MVAVRREDTQSMIDTVIHGDALAVLRGMADNSVDAIITDPPAGIGFMNKEFDHDRGGRDQWIAWLRDIMIEALRVLKPGGHALVWALPRTSHWTATALEDAGFEVRDTISHLYSPDTKLAAFYASLSQEQRNIFAQIIDSQDTPPNVLQVFGSGFPKSLNVSAAIDKHLKAERKVIGTYDSRSRFDGLQRASNGNAGLLDMPYGATQETEPATPEARQYAGYGTSLKPSTEIWWLVRKPLAESSIAAQVLATGTGAINVDACRVGTNDILTGSGSALLRFGGQNSRPYQENFEPRGVNQHPSGRFPSHLLLSHSVWCVPTGTRKVRGHYHTNTKGQSTSLFGMKADGVSPDCPVRRLDEQSGIRGVSGSAKNGRPATGNHYDLTKHVYGAGLGAKQGTLHNDQGTASRYFQSFPPSPSSSPSGDADDFVPFAYVSKASRAERNRGCEDLPSVSAGIKNASGRGFSESDPYKEIKASNHHPTVKPVKLMQWLIRLITPPDGVVLDPFAGSGSTLVACVQEGHSFIGIEQSSEYVAIANARIAYAREHPPQEVKVATKKVKGAHHKQGDTFPRSVSHFGSDTNGTAGQGYTDQDGLEEVQDWDCSPECPIRILGEQSGESISKRTMRGNLVDNRRNNYNRANGKRIANSDYERGHDDQGTAARYFTQFPPDSLFAECFPEEEVP